MPADMDAALPGSPGSPDYGALFRVLPSPYMILDRDLRYVDVNDAYCAVLERPREQLIGRHLFDAFPDEGESGARLRASFRRVLETGEPNSLPLIPYPIERPAIRGGGLEMRFWSAVHVPLLDAEGQVGFIMQNTVDVTELQRLKTMAYGPGGAPAAGEKDLLQRAQELEAANHILLRETEGLRDLFMQAPGFMAVLAGPELRYALVNTAHQQLIGHRQVIGLTVAEAMPEVAGQGFADLLSSVLRGGQPYIGKAVSVRLQRTPHQSPEERFIDVMFQPITLSDGTVSGVFVQGNDVTDQVRAERQQKLLVDELNHRVKNSLATVQAIAHQTMRASPDLEAFRGAFQSRLIALAMTHDLLTATRWRGAMLRDLLLSELGPFGPDHYRLEGGDVDLTPTEVLALGLIVHELATNAAKYGALSNDGGRVTVSWTVKARTLSLTWCERDGPPVGPPTRRGFGSQLIERSVTTQLAGEASLDFAAGGLTCRIALPLGGTA
jgi:two-component sensor histidine kinase